MTRWVWSCLFVGALLVAGAGITATAQGTGTYVCVQHVTGQVRIVTGPDECYPSEAGRSLQGGGLPYAVVDAIGRPVGETIRLDSNTATVVLTIENMKFPLEVTTDGFKMDSVFFPASAGGCNELPYVYTLDLHHPFPPLMSALVGLGALAGYPATLYIPDPTRDPLVGSFSAPLATYWLDQTSTPPTCRFPYWHYVSLKPVKPLVDLNALFTLPFRLQ